LLATRKVQQFTQGVTWNQFQDDEMLQNAVMRLIQIVGEAARKVSPEFKQAHPEIPWQGIIGMRNRLVHDYFRIESSRVWEVIEKDLPALIPLIEPLIPPDETAEKP
jgi:uncharacterized protein with HEPN domain